MGKVDVQGVAEDPMTVLDSECRLRGVSKLRVIDASAMPSIPSGNTNALVFPEGMLGIAEASITRNLDTPLNLHSESRTVIGSSATP